MSAISKYDFTQLIDIRQIENLLKSYFNATDFSSTILDSEENVLVAVGWQDICTKFHRVNPASCLRCRESGAYIKTHLDAYKEGLIEYKCKNGLWDVAFPIVVAGDHLATFFIGQFFYEDDKVDMDFFRNQADEFGLNISKL
jgi:ligand-binding sensor protein